MKAIETTGRIEKSGLVKLDNPTELRTKQKVRIIILYNEDDDIKEELWLTSISSNPAFAFLNDKAEDIYSVSDGKPIRKRNIKLCLSFFHLMTFRQTMLKHRLGKDFIKRVAAFGTYLK